MKEFVFRYFLDPLEEWSVDAFKQISYLHDKL